MKRRMPAPVAIFHRLPVRSTASCTSARTPSTDEALTQASASPYRTHHHPSMSVSTVRTSRGTATVHRNLAASHEGLRVASTPQIEAGVRRDSGDAEEGTGFEVGAGLRYQGEGITIKSNVRKLIAHNDADYEEWGDSGSVRIDPGTAGRGLSVSIAPTWGKAASEAEQLGSARDAGGLARNDEFEAESQLDAEFGYGCWWL